MARILLVVTGGIAAYKSAELVRALTRRGDEVRVVMTDGAREFITPLTLQVLSQNPVGTEIFDATYESEIGHIELARWCDAVLVAPATANFVATLASGAADDLATTVLLATRAPVVIAPAMNTQMYLHPFVQRNLATLAAHPDYRVVTPDSGELACKEVGPGRMPDPEVLLAELDAVLSVTAATATAEATPAEASMAGEPNLRGRRVLISAGPTREHIDPARFLSNPSTGKMGYALARTAARLGADVTLVSGPTTLPAPEGVTRIAVTTAREMHAAIFEHAEAMDVIVKAAAVADWRPKTTSDAKVTKSSMSSTLELERNPDILAELGARFGPSAATTAPGKEGSGSRKGPLIVGFAAESHDVVARGQAKMRRKNAHMLVANKIGGEDSAFGADRSRIYVLQGERVREYGPAAKDELAEAVWAEVARALDSM